MTMTITKLAEIHEEGIRETVPPGVPDDLVLIEIPLKLYSMMRLELQRLELENGKFRKVYFGNRYN